MSRVIELRQDRVYITDGRLAEPYPVFVCDACGRELGTAEPEYHDDAGEWRNCPWCGERLWGEVGA